MYYEINVSLKGKHLFATSKRSITSNKLFKKVYSEISKRFTKKEGFELCVVHYDEAGTMLNNSDVQDLLEGKW